MVLNMYSVGLEHTQATRKSSMPHKMVIDRVDIVKKCGPGIGKEVGGGGAQ